MKLDSRFGEALMLVWVGTAAGLVVGTAALAILFPDVPYGVEYVLWTAVLPAPALLSLWLWTLRSGTRDPGAREPDGANGPEAGGGRSRSSEETLNGGMRGRTVA